MDAASFVIGLSLISVHPGHPELETLTPGAYVEHRASGATAGLIHNSLGRTSLMLGWTWHPNEDYAATIGAANGYERRCEETIQTRSTKHGDLYPVRCVTCEGEADVVPVIALSWYPKIRVLGTRPRISLVPAKKFAINLSTEF